MAQKNRTTTSDKNRAASLSHKKVSAHLPLPSPRLEQHPLASSPAANSQSEQDACSRPVHRVKGRILHTHQVAQRLGISQRTVQYWADSGELAAFKMGKQWSFWEGDIEEYIRMKSEEDVSG